MAGMVVEGLAQPPLDTSMLGVVQGAMRHFGVESTEAEAFFLSGHAFVINIHDELCPSGPYVWNWDGFFELLPNAGIRMAHLASLMPGASASERAQAEAQVREAMAQGAVCSLVNLDHQLILGHDEEGFVLAQPWSPNVDSTPGRLTYGTWTEFETGPPVTFFRLDACDVPCEQPLEEALAYAVDLWEHPGRHTHEPYAVGDGAYEKWLAALDRGPEDEHGNWWNAVVWAECRQHAAEQFAAIAKAHARDAPISSASAEWLAGQYRELERRLRAASDREAPVADKRLHVAQARKIDGACIDRIASELKEAVA